MDNIKTFCGVQNVSIVSLKYRPKSWNAHSVPCHCTSQLHKVNSWLDKNLARKSNLQFYLSDAPVTLKLGTVTKTGMKVESSMEVTTMQSLKDLAYRYSVWEKGNVKVSEKKSKLKFFCHRWLHGWAASQTTTRHYIDSLSRMSNTALSHINFIIKDRVPLSHLRYPTERSCITTETVAGLTSIKLAFT